MNDGVPGACDRSNRKGWMDNRVFGEWLAEPRAMKKDCFGHKLVLFVDNCSGHSETEEITSRLHEIK